jgi:hypothetical protein
MNTPNQFPETLAKEELSAVANYLASLSLEATLAIFARRKDREAEEKV